MFIDRWGFFHWLLLPFMVILPIKIIIVVTIGFYLCILVLCWFLCAYFLSFLLSYFVNNESLANILLHIAQHRCTKHTECVWRMQTKDNNTRFIYSLNRCFMTKQTQLFEWQQDSILLSCLFINWFGNGQTKNCVQFVNL